MLFEFKSWFTGRVLVSIEADTHKAALENAIRQGADLRGADLQDADLRGADLQGAHLQGAHLQGADLRGAHLRGAHLRGADLIPIRDDLWAVLSASPAEVEGLRDALLAGRIDGSVYQGECACLVGTLANVRGCAYTAIPGLTPNSSRPAERWFLLIKQGDTPETSDVARLTLAWIDTWLANMRAAFGEKTHTSEEEREAIVAQVRAALAKEGHPSPTEQEVACPPRS